MAGTGRRTVTGVAVAGVMLTGGVAVAAGLSGAEAAPNATDPSVAALQDRLAQLQSDTDLLTGEVASATTELQKAQAAQAARVAAAERAARAAATAASTPRAAAPAAPRPKATTPTTHTSTGASGASSGEDDHESSGGSDD